MKRFIILLIGAMVCTHLAKATPAHEPETARTKTVRLQITGVAQPKGYIMVAVYSSKDLFLSEQRFAEQKVAVKKNGTLELQMDLPPGQYAVAVYHDTNANGKLDRNLFQWPTEPYGFSNNARSRTGPPAWNDARFDSELTDVLTIKLL